MPEPEKQLDIFGNEIPVEDLPEREPDWTADPPEPGDSQLGPDDPWPEGF